MDTLDNNNQISSRIKGVSPTGEIYFVKADAGPPLLGTSAAGLACLIGGYKGAQHLTSGSSNSFIKHIVPGIAGLAAHKLGNEVNSKMKGFLDAKYPLAAVGQSIAAFVFGGMVTSNATDDRFIQLAGALAGYCMTKWTNPLQILS